MPNHDVELKDTDAVAMDASDGSALMLVTTVVHLANDGDLHLLEDGMHDPVG